MAKAVACQAKLQGYNVRSLEADTEFARCGLASMAEQAEQLKGWIPRAAAGRQCLDQWEQSGSY